MVNFTALTPGILGSNPKLPAIDNWFEIARNSPYSEAEKQHQNCRDFILVVPINGSEDRGYIPTVLNQLRQIGKDRADSGIAPTRALYVEWGVGLTGAQREEIEGLAARVGVEAMFIKADPRMRSAGHSFNEGVRFLESRNLLHESYVMKADDDSVSMPGMFRVLAEAINSTMASIAAPINHRVDVDLGNTEQLDWACGLKQPQDTAPLALASFDELFIDGKFDAIRMYTLYSLGLECGVPNENALAFNPTTAKALLSRFGGIFFEDKKSGEGPITYALHRLMSGNPIVGVPKTGVLDRPAGFLDQRYIWGLGNAQFLSILNRNGLLREGANVALFNPERDSAVSFVHVPSDNCVVCRYPAEIKSVVDAVSRQPDRFLGVFTEPGFKGRVEALIPILQGQLAGLEKLLSSSVVEQTVARPFQNIPAAFPVHSESEVQGLLAHLLGEYEGTLATRESGKPPLVVAVG